MSNSMQDAMTNASGFHEDSNTDAHDIDHSAEQDTARVINPAGGNKLSETIAVTRGIGEGEEQDFQAAADTQDAEGTTVREDAKLHTGTGSKAPTPFWLYNDFKWTSGVNKATGEVFWNLSPLTDRVALVTSYAPGIVDQAFSLLSDEDKKAATAFGQTLRDTCVEAEQINSWLENTAIYAFAREAARNAASAVKWTEAQYSAAGRDNKKLAGEHEVRALDAGRNAAMLKLALITASPTTKINYKGGAWDLFKQDAFRHQKAYMNPDEEAVHTGAQQAAATAGGFALKAAT